MTDDIKVITGPPWSADDYPAAHRRIWDQLVAMVGERPHIYDDSTARPCQHCGINMAVGPRQGEQIRQWADEAADTFLVLCTVCVFAHAKKLAEQHGPDDLEIELRNLGNPR